MGPRLRARSEDGARLYVEPERVGEVAGFPVYNVDALRVWQMLRTSDWRAISGALTRQ